MLLVTAKNDKNFNPDKSYNLVSLFDQNGSLRINDLSNAGEYFLNKVREVIKNSNEMAKNLEKRTVIKLAKLGNDAGIIGSAFLK